MAFLQGGGGVPKSKIKPSITNKNNGNEQVYCRISGANAGGAGQTITSPTLVVHDNISGTLKLTPYQTSGSITKMFVNGTLKYSVTSDGSGTAKTWNITLNKNDEIYFTGTTTYQYEIYNIILR
jgi:hypothetical protein